MSVRVPNDKAAGAATRIKIRKVFNGCPKPDGWFGAFAELDDGSSIKITGTTSLPLYKGMVLDAVLKPSRKNPADMDVVSMSPVTKSMTGIVSYLSSFPGVGRQTAASIYRALGDDAVNSLVSDPAAASAKSGVPLEKINALRDRIQSADQANTLRRMVPELSDRMCTRVIATFEQMGESDYIAKIRKDPYLLSTVPGVSFRVADAAALRMGVHPLEPYRVNHGLVYVLQNRSGNGTYVNLSDPAAARDLGAELGRLLDLAPFSQKELLDRTAALGGAGGPVILRKSGSEYRLFLQEVDDGIQAIAETVSAANSMAPFLFEAICGLQLAMPADQLEDEVKTFLRGYSRKSPFPLTMEQWNAVSTAITNRVSIVTGGPGRGKTTVIDAIAGCFSFLAAKYANRLSDKARIMLLAPTGRAMAKLDAATGRAYEAMTIDRLLATAKFEASPVNEMDRENCLFVIDESSMLDVDKAGRLMRKFHRAKFCFVGDIDQLPPIGKGRVLSDLIESGRVPVARLTVPQRQGAGSAILANADRIKAGDTDIQWDFNAMPFFPEESDDKLKDVAVESYLDELQENPDATELALLCPVKSGPAGVVALNLAIQDIMCPKSQGTATFNARKEADVISTKGHPINGAFYGDGKSYTNFRVGDQVICTKNNYGAQCVAYTNDDYWNGTALDTTAGVFNGECGRIIAFMPAKNVLGTQSIAASRRDIVAVQMANGRVVELDMTMGEFDNFDLAYAMTVHKAQGCEYDTVIYVSPASLSRMVVTGFANRSLFYTAATRAKKKVMVAGSKQSVNACVLTDLPDCDSDLVQRILTGTGGDPVFVQPPVPRAVP